MVCWNLEDIYPQNKKQELIKELNSSVDLFVSKQTTLTSKISSKDFLFLLNLSETISSISNKLSVKTYLKHCENVADTNTLKEMQELNLLLTNLENKLIFFSHFIKELDDVNAKRLQKDLGKFSYSFEEIRKSRKYMRTLEEEKIMNLKDVSGEDVLSTLRNIITGKFSFEMDGKILNESELTALITNGAPEIQIKAYQKLLNKYQENQDVLSEIYKGLTLDWYNESVKIRNYKSSIASRNFSNTLSDETVKMLLDLIREKRNVFQKYFRLKSKVLKLKHSRYHTYAPYILKDKKKYDYDFSKKIVLEVYQEFSSTTYEFAKKIFDVKHVHSDLLSNKKGGAFCYSYDKDEVPYILLNHNDDLNSLLTMAHEFGHGIHGQLAKDKTQSTYHAPLAIAETASIFGEILLIEYLQKNCSSEEKKYLLFNHIDGLFASILRQAYFVIFELQAHEKISEGASVEELNELYFNLLKEQFGEDMEIPEEFKYEWLRIPHIYESPFYCYAYAFGNLLVLALHAKYQTEGKPFVETYLNILKSGGDADIEDILKRAGIAVNDKSFWEGAFVNLEKEIAKLETILKNKN